MDTYTFRSSYNFDDCAISLNVLAKGSGELKLLRNFRIIRFVSI